MEWQLKGKKIPSYEVFQEIVHSGNDGTSMKQVPPYDDGATQPTDPDVMSFIRGMAERWFTSAVKSTNQLPPCASDVVSSEP